MSAQRRKKGYRVVPESRWLLINCTTGIYDGCYGYQYAVYEDEDGELIWTTDEVRITISDPLKLPHINDMMGHRVTPEEAEIITGLAYPAAMDRLREMLYEVPVL